MNENKQLPSVVVPWVIMVHCLLFHHRQGDQVDSHLPRCHSNPPIRPVCGGDSEFV